MKKMMKIREINGKLTPLSKIYRGDQEPGRLREVNVFCEGRDYGRGSWKDCRMALHHQAPGYSGGISTLPRDRVRITLDQPMYDLVDCEERNDCVYLSWTGEPLTVDEFLEWCEPTLGEQFELAIMDADLGMYGECIRHLERAPGLTTDQAARRRDICRQLDDWSYTDDPENVLPDQARELVTVFRDSVLEPR